MPLGSNLFRNNARLQDCLVRDPSHVTTGSTGDHVRLIQSALIELDDANISLAEWNERRYGASTASAVLAYKTKRNIINRAYQSRPDDIVGKMTIERLDRDMLERQYTPGPASMKPCRRY